MHLDTRKGLGEISFLVPACTCESYFGRMVKVGNGVGAGGVGR